jgi:hypothetical protein
VKLFRTWLLLLLVVLLPVRGVMAAAMLCLPQSDARSEKVVVDHLGGGMASAVHDHASHSHDASAAQQKHDGGAVDAHDCNLCASFCSLTVLTTDSPDWRHPPAQATLNATPSAPVPSFVSDGEERPPRTV